MKKTIFSIFLFLLLLPIILADDDQLYLTTADDQLYFNPFGDDQLNVFWSKTVCGNDVCDLDENCHICPTDCGECETAGGAGGGRAITYPTVELTFLNVSYKDKWILNETSTVWIVPQCGIWVCDSWIEFTFEFSPMPDGNFVLENLSMVNETIYKAEFRTIEDTILRNYNLTITGERDNFIVKETIDFKVVKPILKVPTTNLVIIAAIFILLWSLSGALFYHLNKGGVGAITISFVISVVLTVFISYVFII